MKIAFVTDSGTGRSSDYFKQLGIFSVPLQIIDGQATYEDIDELNIDEAYGFMEEKHMLSTSLPSLGKIQMLFEEIKAQGYEQIFAIPICSGLSGTMQAMALCANQLEIAFDCFDTHVTAVVQEYLIRMAKSLHEKGRTIADIKKQLQKVVDTCNTLLIPNDLHHLKRGGRLTPLAATLGGLLKIKPILQINQKTSGKIDVKEKVRTMSKAMDVAIKTMVEEGVDDSYWITIAHVNDEANAKVYYEKMRKVFANAKIDIIKLVATVGVHTGLGCQAVQYFKMIEE